jgi:PAS domain S-box-containing protein
MDGKTTSYLDIVGLPAVGATLLDPRSAFVFAADGTHLLYANAAGAALIGARGIGDALKVRFSSLNPLTAQMARLSRVLPSDTARLEMLRFGQGVSVATMTAACQRLNLADGSRAVLAVAMAGGTSGSLGTRAERLVEAISANDCLAAVLTGERKVVAGSDGIETLALDALIDAARDGAVARRDIGVRGGSRHTGAVRFVADGRTLFLVITGPVEAGRMTAPGFVAPAPAAAPEVIEAAAGDAAGAEASAQLMFPEMDFSGAEDGDASAADDSPDLGPRLRGDEREDIAPTSTPLVSGDEPTHARTTAADAGGGEVAQPETPFAPPRVVQFVFEADAEGRFTFVSPELASIVGDDNAAVVGRLWTAAFGFVAAAPFTGAVAWPAGGDETVAVTLAASRSADGYRGFGSIRPNERAPDTRADKSGLAASAPTPPAEPIAPEPPIGVEIVEEVQAAAAELEQPQHDADEAAQHSIERGHVHRRGRGRNEPVVERAAPPAPTSNIVRLPGAAPVRIAPERLTGTERDAFRRIAEALGVRHAEEIAAEEAAAASPARKEIQKAPVSEIDTRLLDKVPVGIAVFRDRRTLFANRTLLELLGYDSYDAFVEAGGAEAIFPGSNGMAGSIAEAGGRLKARRRDASTLPVKAWLHAVTWDGATALMLSLGALPEREAPDEDALTLDLARSEARADELSAILDVATDGVIVIDQRGKIGSLNRAAEALFGIEASDYAGRYFTDLLADESQKAALDYLDGLAANGVASVLNDGREVIGRVPAGGLIPLFMTMGRIGTSDKFAAVLRDMTHWKNVEAELIQARRAAEAANAQKSDFLAKISHEIRTPLNAIIGFSEVMMGEKFGPVGNERYRSYLHDIHVSGAHLLSLINDLLDLSKIEAGKVDLTFEAVPVNAAIQECVALMQPQANRERIIIRTSLGADVPKVVADQRSFRQILLNVMSNAVKFTRAGGQVIVSSSLEATGEVTVRVRDTGIGMSEKDIETAMKPFRQVAVSKDDREHGTGLGLPLTKALVEANRATFAIDSAPNQGTLVRITFPTTRVLAG